MRASSITARIACSSPRPLSLTGSPSTPHRVHELVARERAARVAREEQQQVELALGELDLVAASQHPATAGLDPQVAQLDRALAGAGSVRRSTASTRAISSAGENGLTT